VPFSVRTKVGFDFAKLSGVTYENTGMTWSEDSTLHREGFFLEFADTILAGLGKPSGRRTKAFVSGGMRLVGAMVKALEVVDGFSLARPAAKEPRLGSDIVQGKVTDRCHPTA
jgi:hypothetical protein